MVDDPKLLDRADELEWEAVEREQEQQWRPGSVIDAYVDLIEWRNLRDGGDGSVVLGLTWPGGPGEYARTHAADVARLEALVTARWDAFERARSARRLRVVR